MRAKPPQAAILQRRSVLPALPPVYRPATAIARMAQAKATPRPPAPLKMPPAFRPAQGGAFIQRMEAVLPVIDHVRPSIAGLTVTATADGLAISGSLSDGTAITGSVMTPIYYIDTSGSGGTDPIKEGASSMWSRARWTKAMRLHNIDVSPKGQGLGDYLAWYVAQKAQKAGIQYILAMHVVPKARNFYMRLGFNEYNTALAYDKLLLDKQALKDEISSGRPFDVEQISKREESINSALAEATLFVPVATLMQRARTTWEGKWRKVSAGNYEAK